MGFSIRLAPGVRIRASSRGLRTSVGPRAARVHFGAGRTGVSTGVGPVGYYTSVGRSSRSARTPGPRAARGASTGSASGSLAAAAAKAEQAKEMADALTRILDLHRVDFPPAQPAEALPVNPPALRDLITMHRKSELHGIGFFHPRQRAQARQRALTAAQQEHEELALRAQSSQREQQAFLDQTWRDLLTNDPDTVLETLAAAFEDNEAAAAPLDVHDGVASLVVLVPGADALPEKIPGTTAAGNLSLRKLTRREANDFYKLMVCGYILATIKEAFAAAPGLLKVAIIAIRKTRPDAYGHFHPEAVMATRFTRESLAGIQWATADATQVVNDASHELVAEQKGAASELQPLDPSKHPEIAHVLDAVNLDDLNEPDEGLQRAT